MGDKKSPTRPKRQAKQSADDGYWDCSVCTFRNTAEAFKCSICDVRKGTSTRCLD
uniref:RanBP2-type domain-containing protein n=1 Tax=Gouania willdenowi TaxID=441366 RepID=A0A8C5HXA0_GOUWI